MKNGASKFLKQILAALALLRNKTTSVKSRLAVFSLLRNRKLLMMATVSRKLNGLMGQLQDQKNKFQSEARAGNTDTVGDKSNAVVLYQEGGGGCGPGSSLKLWLGRWSGRTRTPKDCYDDDEDEVGFDDDKFPDLTHSLFELDQDTVDDGEDIVDTGSVIEMVKNSREESGGEFKLEDEINHVADLYIRRFHWQQRMQKQLSLKRLQL